MREKAKTMQKKVGKAIAIVIAIFFFLKKKMKWKEDFEMRDDWLEEEEDGTTYYRGRKLQG